MPDLSDEIEQAAGDPGMVVNDGQTVQSRPISGLIEADQYLNQKEVLGGANPQGGAKSGWGATRPARVIPPGAV